MFKYLQKKRDEKAKIEASNEKREQEREARKEQERNRIVLTVPDASIRNVLALYDAYRDETTDKNVNRYLLWKKIESALPETKEGNWYIEVMGSNVIKIRQVFSDSQADSYYISHDYGDAYWDVVNKKLSY